MTVTSFGNDLMVAKFKIVSPLLLLNDIFFMKIGSAFLWYEQFRFFEKYRLCLLGKMTVIKMRLDGNINFNVTIRTQRYNFL